MFDIDLRINDNKVIPQNIHFAQNIESFSKLQFTLSKNTELELKPTIENSVVLNINGKQIFNGFVTESGINNIALTFGCEPLAQIANITHMPMMLLSQDLEMDIAPKEVIRRALVYPTTIFNKPIAAKSQSIVDYEVFDVGSEPVRVDMFGVHNETPVSLINSLLNNRNVVITNKDDGSLVIGTLPSIYSNPETHEVSSYISYETTNNHTAIRSAIGINTPIIVVGEFGSPGVDIFSQDFLNIEMQEVQPSTYPMQSILNNVKSRNLFNSTQTVLETRQDFNLGDFIKNKDFNPTMDTFLITSKQLNLSSDKISYNYVLRHKDALSVI